MTDDEPTPEPEATPVLETDTPAEAEPTPESGIPPEPASDGITTTDTPPETPAEAPVEPEAPPEGAHETDPLPEPDPADEMRSQVETLTAERDEALRRLADLESSETAARAQVGERDATIATLTAERDALTSAWTAEKVQEAVLQGLAGHRFVGRDDETRAQACGDFLAIVGADIDAARGADGRWVVRSKDGRPIKEVLSEAIDRRSYLFAPRGRGGSGAGGGNIPAATSPRPYTGDFKAIVERYTSQR